jgi:hypothetical protein
MKLTYISKKVTDKLDYNQRFIRMFAYPEAFHVY